MEQLFTCILHTDLALEELNFQTGEEQRKQNINEQDHKKAYKSRNWKTGENKR